MLSRGRGLLLMEGRVKMAGEDGLPLDWSVDRRFLGDGMEMGEDGLSMELQMEGREETRLREALLREKSVSTPPELPDVVNNTSTLMTRRRPRPMGGVISWTGPRNSSDPIVMATGGSWGCGPSPWSPTCLSTTSPTSWTHFGQKNGAF